MNRYWVHGVLLGMTHKYMTMFAAVAITATLAAGCSSDDGAAGDSAAGDAAAADAASGDTSGGASITIENFDFGEPITVAAGAEFVVTNSDGVAHTWTSVEPGVFASDFLEAGQEFRVVLDEVGTYQFFCEIHPSMMGSVTVVSG